MKSEGWYIEKHPNNKNTEILLLVKECKISAMDKCVYIYDGMKLFIEDYHI